MNYTLCMGSGIDKDLKCVVGPTGCAIAEAATLWLLTAETRFSRDSSWMK
jgi:hypothetical protein